MLVQYQCKLRDSLRTQTLQSMKRQMRTLAFTLAMTPDKMPDKFYSLTDPLPSRGTFIGFEGWGWSVHLAGLPAIPSTVRDVLWKIQLPSRCGHLQMVKKNGTKTLKNIQVDNECSGIHHQKQFVVLFWHCNVSKIKGEFMHTDMQ